MAWVFSAFADEAAPSTEEQIAALQRAGIKHIDPRSVDGHNISALPVDVAEAAQKKFEAAGIAVNMFGSPIGKIDITDDFQIDVDKLTHMAKLSKVFGCTQVRIFSYYNKQDLPKDRWEAESMDRLLKLRDQAGKLGMQLFHENESGIFGDRLPAIQMFADKLRDGDAFQLIFDFDNYNRDGDNVWDNWVALKDATDAFHLKDSDESAQHVPIGQGAGQATKILTDAVSRGWSGPAILEPHLRHSKAVVATHVSGSENKAFADLSSEDVFQKAAEAAISLFDEVGAKWQ